MNLHVRCAHCGAALRAPREKAGKKARCSRCGQEVHLPVTLDPDLALGLRPQPPRSTSYNDTLSRSMLPVSGELNVPLDEMICRLEPNGLLWMDATGALQRFLGRTLDQLRQHSFSDCIHPDDRTLAVDEFRQAAELGERHNFVLRLQAGDGTWGYVQFDAQARYDSVGRINHLRCYLQDVTARVHAEQELRRRTEQLTAANEQLRHANQKLREAQAQLVHSEKLAALGTLASGMAHEINNPLAFVANNTAVLERDFGDVLQILAVYLEGWDDLRQARPELAARIAVMQDAADLPYLRENLLRMIQSTRRGVGRIESIVANLGSFARLNRPEVDAIDVNQAIDDTLALLGEPIGRHRINVQREYGQLPPLECAASDLHQVFLNLLMNALQAIEIKGQAGGLIRVRTRQSGDEIVAEFADNGCGIPDDVLPRIFDPFFTTKPVGQGTGLGLSISHGIISVHGGRIDVKSRAGRGTVFRIQLPTRPVARAAGTP